MTISLQIISSISATNNRDHRLVENLHAKIIPNRIIDFIRYVIILKLLENYKNEQIH